MAYFVDILLLQGIPSIPESEKTVILGFRNTGFRIRGFIKPEADGTGITIHVPNLIYNLSEADLQKGDTVQVYTEKMDALIGVYEVLGRETMRNRKETYAGQLNSDWYQHPEQVEEINCSIWYTQPEMNWIKIGIAPVEMEERVILIVDDADHSINFYTSWQGAGLWKAYFRPATQSGYAVEVFRLIARKRAERDRDRLLSDFSSQIQFHLDTLEYVKLQQGRIKADYSF